MSIVRMAVLCGAVLALSGLSQAGTPDLPIYKDSGRPPEERVDDLLGRMSLEEKVDLVGGTGFTTKPNARLGIPELIMTDGPLGPSRAGKATNYSATINFAATFDTDLIEEVARSIGAETRVGGFNMLLAPMINIARVPHGGRAFECFSEDPYLTARMTVAVPYAASPAANTQGEVV